MAVQKLTRPHWLMSGGIIYLLSALHSSRSAPQTPSAQPLPTFTLRATGPQLPDTLIRAIAQKLPATRLNRYDYPEAGVFTAARIATVLCGRVDDAYMKELVTHNGLAWANLRKPLGSKVYDIEWPACLWVKKLQKKNNYIAKPGDTLSGIRYRFTGVPGTLESNAHFFGLSGVGHFDTLAIGQSLTIPYVTHPTTFGHVLDRATFEEVTKTAAEISPTGDPTKYLHSQPLTSAGRIVTSVQNNNRPANPTECDGVQGAPFNAAKVATAYSFARDRAIAANATRGPVSLFVVDNGFFGARPAAQPGEFAFSKHFPRYYFDTFKFGPGLGPTFLATDVAAGEDPTHKTVYPINFLNGLTQADDLSGHGTHVTGLILGGPRWSVYDDTVFGTQPNSWVRIAELNIGRGSADLILGAEQAISQKVSLIATPSIINMSISFVDSEADVPDSFSFMDGSGITHAPLPHLYVVAAGNDESDAVNYFPAALGGGGNPSVLTVAAIGAHGDLTHFTNKGVNVDVAAPGCNIESWIDDSDTVVALSGTSQAAPTVSFEAALIRSLTGAAAPDLKSRIIVSGDLLNNGDDKRLGTPVAINIPKALYIFDDYVRYHAPDGDHEALGLIRLLSGVSCQTSGSLRGDLVRAYKRQGDRAFAFYSHANGSMIQICSALAPSPDAKLTIRIDFNIVADSYVPAPRANLSIALSDVYEVIRQGPPQQGR
jgi:hypothetical protein